MFKLKRKGYEAISLLDLVKWMHGDYKFNQPVVVITFDDGFENVYQRGFPILQELGFSATIFLTTGYCGKYNNWPTQSAAIPRLPMLNWSQIKEMKKFGFSFEAHTRTHPYLSQIDVSEAKLEIRHSKHDIEDRLGEPVFFFAYPYGDLNKSVYLYVKQSFQGACSVIFDLNALTCDIHLLPRLDMYYFSAIFTEKLFLSPFFKAYISSRKNLRKLRNAL
ncbi:MAG: polysaccharide deacetylase family protein [Nitrosopumilaceae archaeon]|nr:polysaccharide deacetylase family protein [Nitrosopumilaceae archaeon]NIU87729.1 polysaccharide deacetylase family protein [Nitrosopumilaceae archaeon]NIX60283.1 polysaccharide deacetylase family protein [Nitrosopumilaceae archaeon]